MNQTLPELTILGPIRTKVAKMGMKTRLAEVEVIDMDSYEIYVEWENGYPYATQRRGAEYNLTRDHELELMAARIVKLENMLLESENA